MLKTATIVAATVLLAGAAYAQNTKGSSKYAPGQQMQTTTKKSTGPGASEYSPGHQMKAAKKAGTKSTAPGASEYAPGQQGTTTGSSGTKAKSTR